MRFTSLPSLVVAGISILSATSAIAQAPQPTPKNTNIQVLSQQGFQSTLPVVKEIPSRPQRGPDGIDAMLEVSGIDGEFEIIAAQARFVFLKRDLARDGKVRALVAVGHQGVIDVDVIHSRLLRVVGRRIGVTDLTLLTDNNESYTLRVHVVYDLETLRSRLSQAFPETQIPLRQTRETVVVSGMVHDPLEMRNVLRMTGSHLNAEQSVLLGRTSGGGSSGAPTRPGNAGQANPGAPPR